MTDVARGWVRYAGRATAFVVYGLLTFAVAGGLAALFPEHVTAILVGWILSLFVVARLIKERANDPAAV